MNKDELIKALYKRNDTLCKDALDLIAEQEKEIERIKENFNDYVCKDQTEQTETRCRVLELEKQNEQLEKDIISQYKRLEKQVQKTIKQAKIDVLSKLKTFSYCDNIFTDGKWHRYVFVNDIDELIKEIDK